jgi:hypothetical protein
MGIPWWVVEVHPGELNFFYDIQRYSSLSFTGSLNEIKVIPKLIPRPGLAWN